MLRPDATRAPSRKVRLVRLLLENSVERADVERCMADARLRLVAVLPKTDAHPAQLVFLAKDRRTVVHWVVDDRGGVTFLAFFGPDGERVLDTARSLAHVRVERDPEPAP